MFYALFGVLACAIALYFLYHLRKDVHRFKPPIPKPDNRPLEDNPFGFAPNTDHKETNFPWKDVIDCMGEKLPASEFTEHRPCPLCARPSDELEWIKFSSPAWTWKHMAGRAGPLSICPSCKIQVEFICHVMN